jgi:hypothetical protein
MPILGLVGLDIGLRNERGDEGTPGTAVTVWPLENGPAVPYRFDLLVVTSSARPVPSAGTEHGI